jgi:hypothetical protein
LMTAHVSTLLKLRASPYILHFSLYDKKRLVIQNTKTTLSNDTIDSILRHREVGQAKDLSAPPHNREEWKKLLRTAGNCRILHVPTEWWNEWINVYWWTYLHIHDLDIFVLLLLSYDLLYYFFLVGIFILQYSSTATEKHCQIWKYSYLCTSYSCASKKWCACLTFSKSLQSWMSSLLETQELMINFY